MKLRLATAAAAGALALGFAAAPAGAQDWSLEEAAAPYEGTQIKAIFLDRPGYRAAIELIPQFEEATGIDVEWEILPYENSRERQVRTSRLAVKSMSYWSTWSGSASSRPMAGSCRCRPSTRMRRWPTRT